MGTILVTGGAGYVGSHVVRQLERQGRSVVILDDFSEGHRGAVGDTPYVEADFGDAEALTRTIEEHDVDGIVHMAAVCLVGESFSNPAKYYDLNVTRSLAMLESAREAGVDKIVFSSSAAVYGEPRAVPIEEDHPKAPTNPYGETKLAFERALTWYARAHGTRSVSLRYFNAAGAHPDGNLGEDHEPETHLLPLVLQAVLRPEAPLTIFGDDYPTSDGTCVRDYVHVVDLAQAHVLALEAMEREKIDCEAFNLGNGEGFSVREVVDAVEQVTGTRPETAVGPRRAGDPAILVASSEAARRRLGWSPRFDTLRSIIETAWRWHRAHPHGYAEPA